MANTRKYKNFIWHNQMIDGQLVNYIRVRIFKSVDTISSTGTMKLVDTDGNTIKVCPDSSLTHTSGYSYAIFSNNQKQPPHTKSPLCLHIKVYLADSFNVSSLDNKDFLGKSYVLEALCKKTEVDPTLPPLLRYFREKVGDNYYEEFYTILKASTQAYEFYKVEELFKSHKISDKYQALFWKEMYQAKEECFMRKNFKFRWKGLLDFHPKIATVNVKIHPKKNKIFLHMKDLVKTDGQISHNFVYDFSYAIVAKFIERQEDPETYHLDIKVYLTFDFNPKHLPEISDFWGEYLQEAIKKYLASPKKSPFRVR